MVPIDVVAVVVFNDVVAIVVIVRPSKCRGSATKLLKMVPVDDVSAVVFDVVVADVVDVFVLPSKWHGTTTKLKKNGTNWCCCYS